MSKGGNFKNMNMNNNLRKKETYLKRLESYLNTYSKVIIVTANNVGSHHLQMIRSSLRGQAVLLMGKNTMIRKCIRALLSKSPSFEPLLSHIKGNIGFVFTDGDLFEIRNKLVAIKVKTGAKVGMIAPCDVTLSAGPTRLEPSKTAFFQALGIHSRINKAAIEVVRDVQLIKAGNKVTASQAELLKMLNMQPFQYSLDVKIIYEDGWVYPAASVPCLTDADVLAKVKQGLCNIAALGMQVGIPTVASAHFALVDSCTYCSYPEAKMSKEVIANPEALNSTPASRSTFTSCCAADDDDDEEDPDAGGLGPGGLFDADDDEEESAKDAKNDRSSDDDAEGLEYLGLYGGCLYEEED